MKNRNKSRRSSRPPLRAGAGDFKASRAVCRRSDIFTGSQGDETYDIRYASGRREGAIIISATEGGRLDSHALALLVVLCDLYARKQYRIIQNKTTRMKRRAITTTPKKVIEMIYGVKRGKPSQTYYETLGLSRHQEAPGALDSLTTVVIKRDSEWLDASGKSHRVVEAFHLVDSYRFHRIGNREYLQIFLSDELQTELGKLGRQQQWTLVPHAIIVGLGPKKHQALRVALHILSHSPIPAHTGNPSRREIGATALVGIVRPDANRNPDRYPGRFRGLLTRIVDSIDAADPEHDWGLEPAATDPIGKVTCTENERKKGNMGR